MTDRPPPEILLELASAHVIARALHVVADLGVADHLDGEPRTSEELATDVGVHPDGLHRLLRLLETHSVFTTDGSTPTHRGGCAPITPRRCAPSPA